MTDDTEAIQKAYLHPTMYLLILGDHIRQVFQYSFTSHYVSINSSFLISFKLQYTLFTSHYVSINSTMLYNDLDCLF